MAQISWKRVGNGVWIGFLLLAAVLLAAPLNGCATRGFIREEMAPIRDNTTTIAARVSAVEERQTSMEQSIAQGFWLVRESINALDRQTSSLRQKVEQVENTTNSQIQKLGKGVQAAKAEAASARKTAQYIGEGLSEQLNFHTVEQTLPTVMEEGAVAHHHLTNESDKTRTLITTEGKKSREIATQEHGNVGTQAQRILEELEKLKSSTPAPTPPSTSATP